MKIIKNNIFKLILPICLIFAGCEEYLDVNQDPNNPTVVPVENIIPSAQVRMGTFLGGPLNSQTVLWSQHQAASYSQWSSTDQYDVTPQTFDGFWTSLYQGVLADTRQIIILAREEEKPNVEAIGTILEVYAFHMATDLWGDIPYFEALDPTAFRAPSYDLQQDIYADLLIRIDEAIALINPSASTAGFNGLDLMYGGDMTSWRKFANSLKLRMLMRKSDVDEAGSRTAVMAMSASDVFGSNGESANLQYGTQAGNYNPYYDIHQNASRTGDLAVSQVYYDLLNDRNDPRLQYYFQPDAGNGFTTIQPTTNGQSSLYPPGYSVASAYFIDIDLGESLVESNANAQSAPVYYISYPEVEFLMAEAAERWGAFGGNAAAHYNAAITAAFDMHEVPGVATYLTEPNVAYAALANKLDGIALQKYLASFTMSAEAWIHWRRTDVPTLIPAANNVIGPSFLPVRFVYPQLELDSNGENIPAKYGSTRDEEMGAKVWLDVN